MQLVLEKGGYKFIFTCKKSLSSAQLTEVLEQLNNTLNVLIFDDAIMQESTPVNQSHQYQATPKVPVQGASMPQERPAFRDRLPNNVVDVKDLTIQQAVTENALVRCPECGQAHAIIVKSGNSLYLMRKDYEKNEFVTICPFDADDQQAMLNVCCTEKTNRLAYFNDLQKLCAIDCGDFTVNNETEIFCPVCQKSHPFMNWKEAFDNPLSRFETEHLCDACGGEVVEKVVKGKAYTHCENCGLEQPSKEQT